MDLEKMTRELGKAIQASEQYKAMQEALAANEADTELNDMMGKIELIRLQFSQETQKETPDQEKLQQYDKEFKETYTAIMGRPTMMAYNIARQDVDEMMQRISGILALCVNGEDPDTCSPEAHNCSGSCSTCGGCH